MKVLVSASTSLFSQNIIQVISHTTANLWFVIFLTLFFVAPSNIYSEGIQIRDAAIYLSKYGYLPSKYSNPKTADLITEEAFSNALMDFQDFSNLNKTGVLDKETIKIMKTPRCGVPDKVYGEDNRRHKRYTYMIAGQRVKWNNTALTYYFANYSAYIGQNITITEVQHDIKKSFQFWANVTPLTFTMKTNGDADIIIFWSSFAHGDRSPFDGPFGTLAHAFCPGPEIGGDAHFDDSESWTHETDFGQNLVQVATHEFGHALGLGHSTVETAVMAPTYKGYNARFALDSDDISGIQSLYGRNSRHHIGYTTRSYNAIPTLATRHFYNTSIYNSVTFSYRSTVHYAMPSTTNVLRLDYLCTVYTHIDTMFTDSTLSTYVFKGSWFWKLTNQGIVFGYPKYIFLVWPQAPSYLDAALNYNGLTYFFKDNKVWCYSGDKALVTGYPQLISKVFSGIPDHIDAAFVWHSKLYFFKGGYYYPFGNKLLKGLRILTKTTRRPIYYWKGAPDNVTAAFQDSNRHYFIVKDGLYYKLDTHGHVEILSRYPYPRNFKDWWLNCPYYPLGFFNYL